MNNDILRYKTRFLSCILLLGYAFLHIKLTGIYVDTTLTDMANFSVRLPFGQRILIPAIVHYLSYFIPLSISNLFFLIEWLFISLFYFALRKLLEHEFNPKQAQFLSWLCLLLLPLVTVVNYRFTVQAAATFFYPYDTSALFFMAVGFLLCLREKWLYFIPWVFIATLNRESSILLTLMIPALHWQKLRKITLPFLLAFSSYCLARYLVLSIMSNVPGTIVEFFYRSSNITYFQHNLYWLLKEQYIFLFTFCFAGLPLFWFVFYDHIPLQYRPLRYVALFYFVGLLIVGNFTETRLFSEIYVLLYLPVCVAIRRWAANLQPYYPNKMGPLYYVDRYTVLFILVVIAVFPMQLNAGVLWLTHHIR